MKTKFTLEQIKKALSDSRNIDVLFFKLDAICGCVFNATPRLIYPRAGLNTCGKSYPHRDFFCVTNNSLHTACTQTSVFRLSSSTPFLLHRCSTPPTPCPVTLTHISTHPSGVALAVRTAHTTHPLYGRNTL